MLRQTFGGEIPADWFVRTVSDISSCRARGARCATSSAAAPNSFSVVDVDVIIRTPYQDNYGDAGRKTGTSFCGNTGECIRVRLWWVALMGRA